MEARISGSTGLLALIGSPVAHSGSPAMHNYSFEKLGLDYAYVAFDVKEENVKDAIEAMKLFHMRGCNVTMPDKIEAAKYVDELSPAAQIIGAVNTIVNEDGKLTGHITDGTGFVDNLRDHGVEVKGKKVTVAGGGGAGTAIQVQCALDGARELTIFCRKNGNMGRSLAIADKIHSFVPECIVNVYDVDDTAKMTEEIQSSDIFVNATIVGMKPMDDASVVKDRSAFYPGLVVADAVYNPIETKLLREAKEAGCICVGGKGMLLWQGVAAFKLFTGQDMPVEEVKERFFPEIGQKTEKTPEKNLYLIGFMGAGKSTIAGAMKEKLGMRRVEMDERIVQKERMAISDIFDTYGETYFRNLETNLLIELQKETGTIVSCGGGTVLREENVTYIKENGPIILLTAKPETIYERVKNSKERPILNENMSVEFIESLMEKRRERYYAVADIVVETDEKSVDEICEEIINKIKKW